MLRLTVVLMSMQGVAWTQPAAPEVVITLKAGADPWPPYIDEAHPQGGIAVQIANAAFSTQGYRVQNRIMPWSRALEETRNGNTDLILDAWWTQERSQDFMYSRPFLDGPVKFIKRKDDPFEFSGLNSLTGKTIAVVRGYGYDEQFLQARNFTLYEVTDFLQGINMLLKKRVDLAIENEMVGKTQIDTALPKQSDDLRFSDLPLSNNYLYVISGYKNPRHAELINAFNKGLQVILDNGEYARILSEQGLPTPSMFNIKQ